jgi:hypothetical protein
VPARPPGIGRFSEGKAFGSGEGKMESGEMREVEQGLTAFVHSFLILILALGGEHLVKFWC